MPVNSSFSCCTISSVFNKTKGKTCSKRWYHPFSEAFPGNQIQQTSYSKRFLATKYRAIKNLTLYSVRDISPKKALTLTSRTDTVSKNQ